MLTAFQVCPVLGIEPTGPPDFVAWVKEKGFPQTENLYLVPIDRFLRFPVLEGEPSGGLAIVSGGKLCGPPVNGLEQNIKGWFGDAEGTSPLTQVLQENHAETSFWNEGICRLSLEGEALHLMDFWSKNQKVASCDLRLPARSFFHGMLDGGYALFAFLQRHDIPDTVRTLSWMAHPLFLSLIQLSAAMNARFSP